MRPFFTFIIKERANRNYLWIALAGTAVLWVVFKLCYPFPDFFSDSYSYIFAAAANLDVSIWPIGYSKFLYAFHLVSHSDLALVTVQYLLVQLASTYLFFSIVYLFQPSKMVVRVLFIFLLFDPLTLYICNYVNSDGLFAALSIFWFSELLWIICRPRWYQIVSQGVLLFLAFTVRNNAYYYPVLAVLAFLLSRQSVYRKLAGIALGLVLLGVFVVRTREAAYRITGTRQFSLFTGWQLANNALYMYDRIDVDSTQLPTARSKLLDREVRAFFAHVPEGAYHDILYGNPGNFFLQYPMSPLKVYLLRHYHFGPGAGAVIAWGKASADFEPFGRYLIASHPWSFVRYFVLPNTRNYIVPPLEKLEKYNLGQDSIGGMAVEWFDLPTPRVRVVSKDMQSSFLFLLPWLFGVANLAFIGFGLYYGVKRGKIKGNRDLDRVLILAGVFWAGNLGFGLFATILVLRYEFFPLIVLVAFCLLLYDIIDQHLTYENKVAAKTLQ